MTDDSIQAALMWLEQQLHDAGLPWRSDWREPLTIMVQWTQRFSTRTNLVGDSSAMGIVREHILEALTVAALLQEQGVQWRSAVDVGAGAGLEALCLAMTRPEGHMTALEPRRKRADFIEIVADAMAVKVTVVRAKIPQWTPPSPVDLAISRATFAPTLWLKLARSMVKSDGWVVIHGDDSTNTGQRVLAYGRVPDSQGHRIELYQLG
ncbi:MAG TPA: hypothetical protein DCQ06_08630 [Myxococcales bacterium]|nr:hypothetical protein [Myxococcales bacterium]HAN31646.1 hypothetical protein [Myxococcales bacterium]